MMLFAKPKVIKDREAGKRELVAAIARAAEAATVAGVDYRDIAHMLDAAAETWRTRWASTAAAIY
jgi:hypothetical protein